MDLSIRQIDLLRLIAWTKKNSQAAILDSYGLMAALYSASVLDPNHAWSYTDWGLSSGGAVASAKVVDDLAALLREGLLTSADFCRQHVFGMSSHRTTEKGQAVIARQGQPWEPTSITRDVLNLPDQLKMNLATAIYNSRPVSANPWDTRDRGCIHYRPDECLRHAEAWAEKNNRLDAMPKFRELLERATAK